MMGIDAVAQGFNALMAKSAHAMPTQAQLNQTVQTAEQRYPALTTQPLSLTEGIGPFYSETYAPDDPENPLPGRLNIQLRSPQSKADADIVAAEAIHGLQQTDPIYQQFHQQFMASLTPDQIANMQRRYKDTPGEDRPFNQFVNISEVPEYIRGYLFPQAIPGWTGKNGEGQYTPQQVQMLEALRRYLTRGPQEPLR